MDNLQTDSSKFRRQEVIIQFKYSSLFCNFLQLLLRDVKTLIKDKRWI
jgi:hypothetical protein